MEKTISSAGFELCITEVIGRGMVRVLAKKGSKKCDVEQLENRSKESFELTLRSLNKKHWESRIYKIKNYPFYLLYKSLAVLFYKILRNPDYFDNSGFINRLKVKQIYFT